MQLLTYLRPALLAIAAGTMSAQQNRPVLSVEVSDCWGQPIQTETKITILGKGPMAMKEWHLYPQDKRFQVQPGHYSILIEAVGFLSWTADVDLQAGSRNLRACLTLGSVGGYAGPTTMVGKLLKSGSAAKAEELRLFGVYSELSATAIPDKDGAFSFTGIQPGHYVFLVLAGDKILATKEVDVRISSPPLQVTY